jgi:hypothetical protein
MLEILYQDEYLVAINLEQLSLEAKADETFKRVVKLFF